MAAGLQCWDASGRLIVDLGDYMVRFHGSTTITFTTAQWKVTKAFNGITTGGSFAAVTKTTINNSYVNNYFISCTSNLLTAYYLPSSNSPAITLTVEVYSFI